MKKLYMLLAAVFISIFTAGAQNNWMKYEVSSKLSVRLPRAPILDDKVVMSRAHTPDSTLCIVSITDFKQSTGLDSAAILPYLSQPDFGENLRKDMAAHMSDYIFSAAKPGKLNGYYTYSIDGDNPVEKRKCYALIVVIGQYAYTFFSVLKYGADLKNKDEFFASIEVK